MAATYNTSPVWGDKTSAAAAGMIQRRTLAIIATAAQAAHVQPTNSRSIIHYIIWENLLQTTAADRYHNRGRWGNVEKEVNTEACPKALPRHTVRAIPSMIHSRNRNSLRRERVGVVPPQLGALEHEKAGVRAQQRAHSSIHVCFSLLSTCGQNSSPNKPIPKQLEHKYISPSIGLR